MGDRCLPLSSPRLGAESASGNPKQGGTMRTLPSPRARTKPVALLARNDVQLFLVSACVLFTELVLIRWIPALVTYVGFFSNFLLMASFLGIGLGILWGRNPKRIALPIFGPLLLA